MRQQITRLAEVHWRESLKLTLLPAREFLEGQLRARIKLLLAPLWMTLPVLLAIGALRLLVALFYRRFDPYFIMAVLLGPVLIGEAASAGGVAVIAICRMLRSQCQSGNRTGSGVGVAALYSVFLLIAPIGFLLFAGLTAGAFGEAGFAIIPIAALALGGWFRARARAEIDRAIAAYYEIEAAPPKRIG